MTELAKRVIKLHCILVLRRLDKGTLVMAKQPEYKGVVDVAGTVGQFLLNTSEADLIVELIQNELDAGSSRTCIRVLDDRLVCEGNGRNIETAGWKRLAFILAAGGKVAPKQGGIGAKNHGLRVAFWIGDTIHIQSGGQRTQLTTCSNPSKAKFDPGAWDETIDDPDTPAAGTRVSIFYRRRKLSAIGIEGLDLPTADADSAERLIADVIAEAPSRFIAVTHPTQLPRYVLEFVTLRGTLARFIFNCRAIGRADGLVLLERTAELQEASESKRVFLKEQAVRFSLKGLREKRRVSWLFRGRMSAEAELCWEIGTRSRPCATGGTLRYPIAYPLSAKAVSGFGFHISAPFVSDQARHAPAAGDPVNEGIVKRAAEVAARILARHLVPTTGPAALAVIRPSTGGDKKTTALVVVVGRHGGLPIALADRKEASSLSRVRRRASPGGARWPTSYGPVVFPYSSTPATARHLAPLTPKGLPRLHPDVPNFVIETFAAGSEPEICRPFRASDAIDRMCGTSHQFPWRSDKEREQAFADPVHVTCYLKLLSNEAGIVKARADDIKRLALLPISVGGTAPWLAVEWAPSDPPEVPGVSTHKIIYSKLRSLRLLRRGLLKLQTFNLDRRLVSLNWDKVVLGARERYLAWLVANPRRLKSATLSAISKHPIFGAADGSFHKLEALCLIRDPHLRQAMESHVKVPSDPVRSLIRLYPATLKIRSIPTAKECREWYAAASGQIAPPEDQVLDRNVLRRPDRLEQTIQLLLKIADLELIVEVKSWHHKTASKAGRLRPVHALHTPTDAVIACQLAPDDLLGRPTMDLWKILGAREQPSDEAIFRVITDGAVDVVFYRRLAAYLKGGGDPGAFESVACIRTPTGMKPPAAVAIAGRKSFWGRWKTAIKVGVPERARLLEMIGVLPGMLHEQDSRAFFQWLSQQDGGVQAGHCDEIRRHWSEISHGPLRWWEAYPDLKCLPIIAGGKLLLVSYMQAKARPVYLPDFPEINRQFSRTDTRHGVVDDSIHRVFPDLRAKGIPSLRDTLITKGTTTLVGKRGPPEKRHQETVRLIQIGASRRALSRELDRVGLGRKSLMPDCMRMLEQLTEARRAEKVIARYRIGGANYEAEVSAALGDDNILWMTAAASDMAPFEAIAHRLVRAGDEAAPYKLFLAVQHLRAGVGPLLISSLPEGGHEAEGSRDDQEREGQAATPAPGTANGGGVASSGHATPTFKEPAVPNPTRFPHSRPEDFAASGKRPIARSGISRTPAAGSTSGAARDVVGIRRGAISGNMKVSFQAAMSIG